MLKAFSSNSQSFLFKEEGGRATCHMALCLPLFSLFLLLVARPLQGERGGATCQQAFSFSLPLCFLLHLSLSVSSRKRAGLPGCILLQSLSFFWRKTVTGKGQERAHRSLVSGGCDYRKNPTPFFLPILRTVSSRTTSFTFKEQKRRGLAVARSCAFLSPSFLQY